MKEQLIQGLNLSPLQKRVWTLQSSSSVFFVQVSVIITGEVDTERLAQCIDKVVDRHEVFRTVFIDQPSLQFPVQDVGEMGTCHFELSDCRADELNFLERGELIEGSGKHLLAFLYQQTENEHLLILQLPALLADLVTMQKLVTEIAKVYQAGNEPDTDDRSKAIQYGQFAEWQLELISNPDDTAAIYWQKQSFQPGNEYILPFNNYNTRGGAFQPAVINIDVPEETISKLLAIENEGITSEALLMACYYTYLQRCLNSEELTLGISVPGREYAELEDIMGLLSTTLPVQLKPEAGETILMLAERLSEQTELVKEFGEYFSWPDSVQTEEKAYFRSLFEYGELLKNNEPAGDLRFRISRAIGITDRFDIKLQVLRTEQSIQFLFYYDTAVLNEISAKTSATQIGDIIKVAAKNINETVETIASESVQTVLFEGDVNFEETQVKNMVDYFDQTVRLHPHGIALQEGEMKLTYLSLDEQSTQMANWLRSERNVKQGHIVALSMGRSMDMIKCILGIIKAGAAYLPLDVKTPASRLQYMMQDSNATLMVTNETGTAAIIPDALIINDAFWNMLSETETEKPLACANCKNNCSNGARRYPSRENQKIAIESNATAYVIYTSGSTGKPKGVLVSHGSLVNYSHWFISKYKVTDADRTLLFSSVAFDLSYTSLWSSLLGGATLFINKENEFFDPIEFINDLTKNEITYIKLTPSHFNLISRDPDFDANIKKYNLRLIVVGGEEVIAEDIEKYLKVNPAVQFVNHYGPTEATIGVLTKNISNDNIGQFRKKTVVGKANANNQVFILNRPAQRLCAVGETGEICVNGKGLATGYLNHAELTAEKFVRLPFLNDSLNYCTGDLGRWMPDGNIEFIGRKDFQIKIRGYRVEVGEIEEALLVLPGVHDASVLFLEITQPGDKKLVAFLKTAAKINTLLLRGNLEKALPDYMVPSEFVCLTEFPLLPNGKIDRVAMKELALHSMSASNKQRPTFVAPKNNAEKILVGIWKEILNGRECGTRDNFVELGGHSLKAAQLVSRIYKAFDKKIELRVVFDCPTIEQLALILQKTRCSKKHEAIHKVHEQDFYEVSHAQKRLWILSHFKKDSISYNSSCYYRINGELDVEALKESFKILIERHESLRTTFVSMDGLPRQQINSYESCGFFLDTADVRSDEDPAGSSEKLAQFGYYEQFDLEHGPLLRAIVIRECDEVWLFSCNIHHIIYDGWSLKILFGELLTIYNALKENIENPLEPLRIQYKDYAAWHNGAISSDEEKYWLAKLANYPKPVSLPYDKINSPDDHIYARETAILSEEDSAQLKEIARSLNCTLSNLFLSLYGLFINQVTGQHDVMIGIGHANRNHEDTEKLIGFFINMLVIRIRFSEDDTLDELARQVSESALEAFQNSNYPFDLLVEKLCINRYADRQPIINVMYDYKNFYDVQLEGDIQFLETSLHIEELRIGDTIAAHDLILHVIDNDKNIMYDFEYKKECFLPKTVQNFYSLFNKLIQLFIAELSTPVSKKH